MSRKFHAGEPACPVACKYCFITEHEIRREIWNQNPIMGVNKACTFVNVTPWISEDPLEQERFKNFPWEILQADFVGFTAITDPFFPRIDRYLWEWLERASEVAKLTTCVTKWPISKEIMKKLAQQPNFFLVVGITGNWAIEKVSLQKHLRTLQYAKEYGVKTLPISHPYITGVSNLDFLPELKKLGYDYFDIKGLRYCSKNMSAWMPESSKPLYTGFENQEILPEDGWREKVFDAGLTLLSPRQWYLKEGSQLYPHVDEKTAQGLVKKVFGLANVVSSDQDNVFDAAVQRRL